MMTIFFEFGKSKILCAAKYYMNICICNLGKFELLINKMKIEIRRIYYIDRDKLFEYCLEVVTDNRIIILIAPLYFAI